MSEMLLAYCGLDCGGCPAYIATKANDTEKLMELAAQWFQKENDAETCRCMGCKSEGPRLGFCEQCAVRTCASERGVVTCAHCADYGCDILLAHFEQIPDSKVKLEAVRQTL